jgi:porin
MSVKLERYRCGLVFVTILLSRYAFAQADPVATQPVEPTTIESYSQVSEPAGDNDQSDESNRRNGYDFWTADKLTGDWGGFRTALEERGFSMELSYQSQYQQNYSGGLETRNACRLTGTYDGRVELDFKKLGLYDADLDYESGFYFQFKGSYGESIQDKVGSLFDPNADPADKDQPIFVDKWWLWQEFFGGKLELRLGVLQTVKDLFDVSRYANHEDRDFLNQASYRNTTVPHRTGMGAFARVKPIDWWYLQAAAIDAQAREFRTRFDTAFHDEAWYLGFWETGLTPEWKTAKGPMPGRYRIGFWYDPRPRPVFERVEEDQEPDRRGGDVGLYLGLDQMVWKEKTDPDDEQGLGVFTRYGTRRGDINQVNCYWQVGASYKGLLPGRDSDVFGFACSQGILSKQYREIIDQRADRETVYEWYYAFELTPAIIIGPDLQIITNPGGTHDGRDAIVGGVRIRIIF